MIETIDVLIEDLPSAFRFVRYGRGKTLREVAAETGLSYSFLSQVENKQATPNTVRARTLAKWILNA
jgi:transcriptional regulator with XRE-family HTH domain